MTVAYERIELPRYCRPIARTRRAGTHGAAARHRTIVGRLGRFAGVLTLRLAAHDWTPADLAHLALTRLARPSRPPAAPHDPTASTHDSPSADDPTRTTGPAAADRTVDQPRVRDVVRTAPGTAPGTAADPAPPTDRSPSDSHERRRPLDIGVLLDGTTPPQPATVAGVGREDGNETRPEDATEPGHAPRPGADPSDQDTVDRSQALPSRPADGSTAGVPPRTTVIRRQETAERARADRPATGGEADASPPSGALSPDDPLHVAVLHPTVTRTGDSLAQTPHRATRFSRRHRRALVRSDVVRFGDAARNDRQRAGNVRDAAEPNASHTRRPVGGLRDEPARLEPLDGAATAAGWPPIPGASPTARPASGTGDGPPDERMDGPPLVVRRHATPGRSDSEGQLSGTPTRRGDAGDQPGSTTTALGASHDRLRDDPSVGHPHPGATNGSPAGQSDGSLAGQSVGASAGQRDARSPERLEELIDVDALVDRLTRAFERAARIERERRGR